MDPINILFVCTGNTCRSPMASALAQHILKDLGISAQVESAGISAVDHAPIAENALAVLEDMYLDVPRQWSRQFTSADLHKADIVITMTQRHRDYLRMHEPDCRDKIVTLGELAGETGDVEDPFGGDLKVYQSCAAQLKKWICKSVPQILNWRTQD